jgi:fumarate reductase subunit D
MATSTLLLLLFGLVIPIHALPIKHLSTHLTNEAIIGLVGVIVAVVVFGITFVASPKLRANLRRESHTRVPR